jgi:hypothetical protein
MTGTVADHVLCGLREWGSDQVFASPGDGVNGLVAAFGAADNVPRFVQARQGPGIPAVVWMTTSPPYPPKEE